MITLYRKIKLWTLKTKWELALWQFIDTQIMELIKDPEAITEKILPDLINSIRNENKLNN